MPLHPHAVIWSMISGYGWRHSILMLWFDPWFQGTGDATPSSCCDLIHDFRVRVTPLHPQAVIWSMISGYRWRHSILKLWFDPWFQGTGDATPSSSCDLIHDFRVQVTPLHPHAVIWSMISGYGWRHSILMRWFDPWFQGTGDATPSSCCDLIHNFRVQVTPLHPHAVILSVISGYGWRHSILMLWLCPWFQGTGDATPSSSCDFIHDFRVQVTPLYPHAVTLSMISGYGWRHSILMLWLYPWFQGTGDATLSSCCDFIHDFRVRVTPLHPQAVIWSMISGYRWCHSILMLWLYPWFQGTGDATPSSCCDLIHDFRVRMTPLHPHAVILSMISGYGWRHSILMLWFYPWFQGTGDATPSSCCDFIHDFRVRVMPLHPQAMIMSMISGYGWRHSILMLWFDPWFQGTDDATPSSCCDFIHDFRVRVTPLHPHAMIMSMILGYGWRHSILMLWLCPWFQGTGDATPSSCCDYVHDFRVRVTPLHPQAMILSMISGYGWRHSILMLWLCPWFQGTGDATPSSCCDFIHDFRVRVTPQTPRTSRTTTRTNWDGSWKRSRDRRNSSRSSWNRKTRI